jgi:hypothetical protein
MGDTHLSTFLYLSEVSWDRFEPHLNLGIHFNADDINHSSFLYVVGSTLQVGPFGFVVDFIGRSEFEGLKPTIPPAAIISNCPYAVFLFGSVILHMALHKRQCPSD